MSVAMLVIWIVVLVEKFHALDAFHHHFVGTQGSGEVGKAFLIFQEFEHFAVAGGFLQLVFHSLDSLINVAQMGQVVDSGFKEQIKNEAVTFACFQAAIFSIHERF
jgi:hypothetical protein